MNVASLELCKELYELSGWTSVDIAHWNKDNYPEFNRGTFVSDQPSRVGSEFEHICPAYDLGYLLRKLPPYISKDITKDFQWLDVAPAEVDENNTVIGWHAGYKTDYKYARTPENALCKLAIELLKQGILPPQQKGNR